MSTLDALLWSAANRAFQRPFFVIAACIALGCLEV